MIYRSETLCLCMSNSTSHGNFTCIIVCPFRGITATSEVMIKFVHQPFVGFAMISHRVVSRTNSKVGSLHENLFQPV
jgi:hypothetical protein